MKAKGSKRFKLNEEDLRKVFKGLVLAMLGAAATYLSEFVASADFGVYTPLVVAGWGVALNLFRKLVANNS